MRIVAGIVLVLALLGCSANKTKVLPASKDSTTAKVDSVKKVDTTKAVVVDTAKKK